MAKLQMPCVAGFFTDPKAFVHAAEASTAKGWNSAHQGFMPYPVHAAFHALGIKRSLLGRPVLFMLLTGAFLGFLMQLWMMKYDWPILISGKPYNSWPAFVVITFESGVLSAALTNMFLVLFVFNKLFPNPVTKVIKRRLTDDTFCLAIPVGDGRSADDIRALLAKHGAESVEELTTDRCEPAGKPGSPFDA